MGLGSLKENLGMSKGVDQLIYLTVAQKPAV
jgi:hypothetical protein